MKFAWRKRRAEKGLPTDKPNIILGHNVQVALEKFALYFDVEARYEGLHRTGVVLVSPFAPSSAIGSVAIWVPSNFNKVGQCV